MDLQAALKSPQGAVVGSSFFQMLNKFLLDLKETFPERDELDLAIRALAVANDRDPMSTLTGWQQSMEVMKKAGHPQPFFTECTAERIQAFLDNISSMNPLLRIIPFDDMWNDPGLIDEDRQAIWDHLQQLELSAMTIGAFDPKAIKAIEDLAKNYMGELQSTDPSQLDVKALGFDVVRRVMKDPAIKAALADPLAETRFQDTFGKDGEKLTALTGQSGGLSSMLGGLMGGAGGGPAPELLGNLTKMMGSGGQVNEQQLMGMMQQMGLDQNLANQFMQDLDQAQPQPAQSQPQAQVAPQAPSLQTAQINDQVMNMMRQMGLDPQLAKQFQQDKRF